MEELHESFTTREIAENFARAEERSALFRRHGVDQDALRSSIVRQLEGAPAPVLEVGTGKGRLTVAIARTVGDVVSVDTDPDGMRMAALLAAYYGVRERIHFLLSDAARLAYPDGHFDTAVSAFTLHHLERPEAVFDEMARVTGRLVLISDFNEAGFAALDRIHESEGRAHDRGSGAFGIRDAGDQLVRLGFRVRMVEEELQTMCVATRGQ
ncbi:MAG TPA: class I SAM-dependent methyltransferase [Spirochaetota bacterium]|nr:class I SAM-dependent methyltransferase [Spirochaetota bacterium]HPI22209.1 class I SAM-dependent methyltransferase [Spirochaetota bacterium]HPU88952.1 class I SAM-dependent methyltransferase [Spirochaetota bacterium]